jgi:hypothetical protein
MTERQRAEGDLRTEAAELLDVLVERLAASRRMLDLAPPQATPPAEETPAATEEQVATGSDASGSVCPTCGHDSNRASCTGCPLCALLAMLRGEKPELTAKLVDGALTALQAVRGLLGDLPATADPSSAPAEPIVKAAPMEQPRPTERIVIR